MAPVRATPASGSAFIPSTRKELLALGWDQLDVILVTGDTHVDSPHVGAAVIGRVLLAAGYRVGVIAQPDIHGDLDIKRLGAPKLFWGVTSGAVDSMVANYTASGKRRKHDDMTPGGLNNRRPDRAVIVYSNLIRRFFTDQYIVLGGIEASLRRISHYDAWSNKVRRSILFDAKADVLVYGMGEAAVLELAAGRRSGEDISRIRGICYISRKVPPQGGDFQTLVLPSHSEAAKSRDRFTEMFRLFYENADPVTGKRLCQLQDTRFLVQNPPAPPLVGSELDRVYELPYTREVHPFYGRHGKVAALDTIRFSITTHRGCYGECRFCAITVHQGRHVSSRSQDSIIREARDLCHHPRFKGIISNVGGATANMYGIECERKKTKGACRDKGCLFPEPCRHLPVQHRSQLRLLRALDALPGIRKVFVGSGIRYDMILYDKKFGRAYLKRIMRYHTSGQMKIAPEHSENRVLNLMGKPGKEKLEAFVALFRQLKQTIAPKIFLICYLMAAHPGCTMAHMRTLRKFLEKTLHMLPEQVQVFTPSPATWSTLMYYTEKDPFNGQNLAVEKHLKRKNEQKQVVVRSVAAEGTGKRFRK